MMIGGSIKNKPSMWSEQSEIDYLDNNINILSFRGEPIWGFTFRLFS